MPSSDDRLANLVGVLALAVQDRVGEPVREAVGRGGSAGPALVHLQAHPGSSVDRLARVLGTSQPATVRTVDRLQDDGLVRRAPGPDRRTLALVLTDEGDRRATVLLRARQAALAPLLEPLDAAEREVLHRLLERMVDALVDDRPDAERCCRLCDRHACAGGPEDCFLQRTVA